MCFQYSCRNEKIILKLFLCMTSLLFTSSTIFLIQELLEKFSKFFLSTKINYQNTQLFKIPCSKIFVYGQKLN